MIARFKISLLLLTVIFIGTISCKRADKRETEVSVDSLTVSLAILHDSLDHAWQVMIDDDDEKILFMKRVLQEVSHTGNYDKNRLKELSSAVDTLKQMRYDRETMESSSLIDRYDSATDETIRQIVSFTYAHPKYEESELMKRLVKDITDKNQMVLIYRVHYDAFAEEINEILQRHGDKIDTSGKNWRVWPLFKLPPDNAGML